MLRIFSSCLGKKSEKICKPCRFKDNVTIEEILAGIDIPDYMMYSYKYETNNNYYVISTFCSNDKSIKKYSKKIMLNYVPVEEIDESNICPICLDETKKTECIVNMSVCKHQFHKNCAIKTLDAREECPLCRKNIDKDLEIIQDYKYKQSSYCSSDYSTSS